MISLKNWMDVVNYRITEGDSYGWPCFGPNTHQLSAWNGVHGKGGWSFNIVFDTEDQTVYMVEACDYTNDRAYRLINPNFTLAHNEHAKTLGEFANQAWDDVNYTDLEVDEDWLEKAEAIAQGLNYDTNISVPLDFTDEELLKYMIMAHERNITFNQFVEDALRHAIEEHKRDPEGWKLKAEAWVDRDQET
jgi:hypothetical protein